MIVRVAVAVAVTTALLGASAPAISTARADRADAAVQRQVTALSDRLDSFVARDDATRAGSARRVVTLRLPSETPTSRRVDSLTFQTKTGNGVASWQVADRAQSQQQVVSVPLRSADGPVTLREPGPHRLAFTLRETDDERVVTVRRITGPGEGPRDA